MTSKAHTEHARYILWPIPVGSKIRTQYGNFNDRLYHVRGHVDDLIVIRWWRTGKQRWHYECFDRTWWLAMYTNVKVELP